MLKRHEVQVLLKAGHRQVEAARLAGVSVSSVKRIAGEVAVTEVEDAAERAKRGIGRPSRVEHLRGFVEAVLRESPQLPSHEVLRRARLDGYTGGKSALYGVGPHGPARSATGFVSVLGREEPSGKGG